MKKAAVCGAAAPRMRTTLVGLFTNCVICATAQPRLASRHNFQATVMYSVRPTQILILNARCRACMSLQAASQSRV